MQDLDGAMQCYEQALKHNQWSIAAMQGIACILRARDQFPHAVEYLRTILKVDPANGDVWGSLGRFSHHPNWRYTSNIARPLLPHDGRSAASLFGLPAGLVSFV